MKEMQSLISSIWRNKQIPNDWKTGIICPIFKKGGIGIVSNYSGISLLDLAYKVLSMALLRRQEVYAEETLAEYQTGFRRGKSTTDHIFTLRQLMEKYYEYNKDLHILFVDFRQAYDNTAEHTIFHCPNWDSLRDELRARLGHPPEATDGENILCGPLFEDLPMDQTAKATVLNEAEETFRLFYKMVEEILPLKEIEERARQAADAAVV
ncbi:Reverse transcriptase domain-containing protein [Aphis craccivora]|uniref:Reverse transcriptase domain-containing protein n=1 Tax=Aphis craccivora TaxID=307492 RepID=A0A6G0YE52_APHCR|nr:Reverse transcriptase domain-containing protein [Aphis craccivora]